MGQPFAPARTRISVVPDLDEELVAALGRLEEILVILQAWEDDKDIDVDLPEELTEGHALAAVRRLQQVVRPTQGRTGDGRSGIVGPRLLGPYGRGEHLPLRFVHVVRADLAALAAATTALGCAMATPHPDIATAVTEHFNDIRQKPVDIAAEAARIHELLDLQWTPDLGLLYDRITAAGDADAILTVEEETAYQRTTNRLNGIWTHGSHTRHVSEHDLSESPPTGLCSERCFRPDTPG